MKKLLASLIVSILILSCCLVSAMPASAADGINYDDWLIFDGAIIEYVGSDADVVVPTKDADGLPITKIESNAFSGTEASPNMTLETVIIPEGITEIGYEVFQDCKNLVEVSLPYSLEKAGYGAFRHTALVSITIPGNLKEIPHAFTSGAPISEYIISYGVEVFTASSIYANQTSEIIFPSSVYEIAGEAMFYIDSTVGERMNIYITNDDCSMGKCDGNPNVYTEDWGNVGPSFRLSRNGEWYNSATKIHVYGLKDGNVKDYIKQYMSDPNKPWYNAIFHAMSEEELAEKDQFCKDNAVKKSSDVDKDNDTDDKDSNSDNDDDDDDNNDNKNGDSSSDKNNNSSSLAIDGNFLVLVLAIGGGIFLLIIIAVVVVVIVMANKKNKKKKKKKAKVEAPLEEAPIEEVPAEETPIEEVPTEETPIGEVPAEKTPIEEVPEEKGEEE